MRVHVDVERIVGAPRSRTERDLPTLLGGAIESELAASGRAHPVDAGTVTAAVQRGLGAALRDDADSRRRRGARP